MWKITALLTTLVIGSTASIAMASPTRSFDSRPGVERVRIEPSRVDRMRLDREHDRLDRSDWQHHEHRRDAVDDREYRWSRRDAVDDFGPRRYRPTWVALSAPQPLTRAEDCIDVTDRGTFTQLRLQTESGRARIDRVTVQFADGSAQVAALDRVLDARSGYVDIPLDGNNRRIDKIIVTGATGRHGGLQVFGI